MSYFPRDFLDPHVLQRCQLFISWKLKTNQIHIVNILKDQHYLHFQQLLTVQFSCSVVSDSLRPHESQHARPPCPSPTPGVHSNSCPSSWWCHPAISSSVIPFSWSPLEWTGRISLQPKGLSRVFSNTTVQKHQFFGAQFSSQSNSHIHTWPLEKP